MKQLKVKAIVFWILRIVVAAVLLQSLFFKFTGAQESIFIFSTVGNYLGIENLMEPYGRIATGVAELFAATMLLFSPTVIFGALLSLAVIIGALFFHLFTDLGLAIVVNGESDGGLLFILAVVVFVASVIILLMKLFWKK